MIEIIKSKIEAYNVKKDVHSFELILEAADIFIECRKNGSISDDEIELSRNLIIKLVEVSFIASIPQYEHDYKLQNRMLIKKKQVFKLSIPESHKEIRGLTEMLIGMKENELG
ncbi:MAG: hypothetical protein A3D31_03345 [Candidatus Fluviicola riflensis]|nr:MAG: hypothetical protein CHH17_11685 [Candidatus Fluviicola riflensis]OGS79018.1 MAG: hypothetical protein A3D31_03345 [Candidatus Fluviicola riflensis]OGS86041.1 MAG: hypothetical protein A3E30_10835 [Fluviicola sp. RIFCSPHIGHO2_12_FULL_43_24]OGS86450.1 MAG: hypothetical protein A2724_02805 [Fluviicola sp. RIFCSPHIGHO2_01_FULL_43_53]